MRKPVVLVLENSIDVTGALKSIATAAVSLKDDFDFQFILPRESKAISWLGAKDFKKVHELPLKEINRKLWSLITYIPALIGNTVRLRKIIKKEKIDILHVNDVYNMLPVTLWISGCKIPYVCHIRFLPNRFPAWLFNFWLKAHLRFATAIIAVSKSVLNMLPHHPKLVLIYDPLPKTERYPEVIANDQEKRESVFLYLSNFIEGKGHNFAVEAFASINDHLPDWKLRLVGGDMGLEKNSQYKESLKQRAKALNIFEKTEWREFTEDVEQEYKQADIVLNFSESESFSITCLEALFFGRPLIATDCGGPSEIVDHLETGILVTNRSIPEMANAMVLLANDRTKRNKFAQRGRIVVREKFNVEQTYLQLKAVYEAACKK